VLSERARRFPQVLQDDEREDAEVAVRRSGPRGAIVGVARLVLALLPCVRTDPEGERARRVSAPERALTGDELLAAVNEAMVGFHQRYYHRRPVTAKTMLLGDDLLACVLGGVYTEVEKTMIELRRSTLVQETRNAFQTAMQDKFIKAVQDLSGRRVLAFISDHHVGPDIEIELFLLVPDGISEPDGWTHID
jgi:uncharacterized protein YbcI